MKIFKKSFINEITDEIGAAINVERYLSVNHILKKSKIKTPKILSYDKSSIIIEYINLTHTHDHPNFEDFHNATDNYYRSFDMSKAEYRLQFLDRLDLKKSEISLLKNVALESIEYVLENEPCVFLHMDAVYKNYFANGKDTVWIDFQDAMMGPKSYDEVHYLVNCFEKTNFDIDKFSKYQQKSAVYNSIRQYGIFSAISRFRSKYIDVTKYNVNKILKGLDYDLEIT